MKKQIYNIKLLGVFLLGSTFGFAQTTNTGVLHVNPGTIFSSVTEFDNQAAASFTNNGESYFYSHFNNDGTVGFDAAGERLTRFEAPYGNNPDEVQELTGANLSHLFDIQFNNDTALMPTYKLHSQISVANEADFNLGIVQDDVHGGLLIFEDDATAISVSDDSHVDGKVQKKGDDAFTYPIGDIKGGAGYYRYAAIDAPGNVDHDFTAKYFFETPIGKTAEGHTPTTNKEGNISLIDNAEFWTITKDKGSADVMLTLSYDAATTPTAIHTPEANIRIVHWDDAQKLWVDLGGIVDANANHVTTPATLDEYGIFTLARVEDTSELIVYNGISNNGDGDNDYFFIKGIKNLANNNVKIFNRWGVKVYETDDYDSNGNVFKGFSNGRATIKKSEKLPTGTYFYVVSYDYGGKRINKSGYLYLTTE
ncbi:gliding motility-associated C-terminal domain-containing protein [Flavobacteriaceae bacterium]|nr:gliding motility-associated C-terminal domain-containing protein [Flavobacteriaceae bacterium]